MHFAVMHALVSMFLVVYIAQTLYLHSELLPLETCTSTGGLVLSSTCTYTTCADCNLHCDGGAWWYMVVVSWKWCHGIVACGGCCISIFECIMPHGTKAQTGPGQSSTIHKQTTHSHKAVDLDDVSFTYTAFKSVKGQQGIESSVRHYKLQNTRVKPYKECTQNVYGATAWDDLAEMCLARY